MAKFVSAYESADLDALVVLLTDDVFISMPPIPFEYEGRDLVARFFAGLFGADRRFELVRTRANGRPAFGAYLRAPTGIRHGAGLYVLSLSGDRICVMTRSKTACFPGSGYRDRFQAYNQFFAALDSRQIQLARNWCLRYKRLCHTTHAANSSGCSPEPL